MSAPAPVHPLQCLEVWGDNSRVDEVVSVPGIDAWIRSIPFADSDQGGDLHYVSMCGAGRIARFALADVSGHGDVVGPVAVRLQDLMRKNIRTLDQTKMARALNTEFTALAEFGTFATALLMTYYAPTDHLIICNAGHPKPLWYSVDQGSWTLLDDQTEVCATCVENVPLGVIDTTTYAQFAVPLDPGDIVVMYTDSLIEARGADGEQLGEDGLLALVQDLGPVEVDSLTDRILLAVDGYRGGSLSDDDQTILVLRHNAGDPPRQSIGDKLSVMAKMVGLKDT